MINFDFYTPTRDSVSVLAVRARLENRLPHLVGIRL